MSVKNILGQVCILNDDELVQVAAGNLLSETIFFPPANGASFEITETEETWIITV